MRAYAVVRRTTGNPDLHIANGRVVAVCAPHVPEFATSVLKPATSSMEASARLVANRPDVDSELQNLEAAGKGRETCVVCSNGMRSRPSGKPVTMADLAAPTLGADA